MIDFEDAARVVVETAGEGEIELDEVVETAVEAIEHKGYFVATFQADFALGKHGAHGRKFVGLAAGQADDGLKLGNLRLAQTSGGEFFVHIDFIEFVDVHRDVDDAVGRSDDFGDAAQDFAIVDLDGDANAEAREHLVDDLHQLHLIEQRVGADHVGIALIKLAVAAFLWAVGAPHGLDLVAFERHLQFVAVLHDVAREGHGEVVAQTFFAKLGRQCCRRSFVVLLRLNAAFEVAAIEDFEQEFVALFAIFAHEGRKVFHGGRFDGGKSVESVDAADGVEDIVAARHFDGAEVARAFGYAGFLCHESEDVEI